MADSFSESIEQAIAVQRQRETERRAKEDTDGTAVYNRYARFLVTPECLMTIGSGTFRVTASPLPDDVRCVGGGYDDQRGCFVLVLASESFEPVRQGDLLPEVSAPTIQRVPE